MLYELSFQNGPIVWQVTKSRNLSEVLELCQKTTAQYIYLSTFSEDNRFFSVRCFRWDERHKLFSLRATSA